ncbi:ATP-binding protein [Streptodolium elevatio]|uniref:AAA family ATPase n=1 Tax=Streptodolium elevatio TaxID=3157996 RepID=A0ABV3DUG4_9ACTN
MTAPSERLIGRGHAAGVLRAQVERATASHGGLVLVTGEAGIGKTTLVADAAEGARRRGALVLGGSCWDSDNAPGYWPWVQVLRSLRRALGATEWDGLVRPAGPGVGVLLGAGGGEEAAAGADGEAAGDGLDAFQVFDAVTTLLVSVSQDRPVVVVLDDLHWADSATLRLLEFAAQHAWFERLLLVGTYRDAEAESAGHPLRPLILPLVAKATTVTLTGLERDEVGALMARTAGRAPERALVAEVHRRTGGNPFFVEQTARLWTGGGDVSAVPPSVREAVRRRLSLLPDAVAELLTTASVLGRAFDRKVLAAVAGAPDPHVDRLLEQAVAARLVASSGGGRFEFAHDLVRETLYDALDEADVRKRHAGVVAAVTASPGLARRSVPADLARHAYAAGPELDPGRALDLLVDAAKEAEGRFAFEEAEGHYLRADEVAVRLGDVRRRALVRLGLAEILRHAGDDRAWGHFEAVAAMARTHGDVELLARNAITLYRYGGSPPSGATALDVLREAHTALIGRGDPVAEGLAADRLARELAVRIAVLARRGADDEALAFSLWATHDTIWGPGTAAERLPLTDEMIAVGRRSGDVEMELHATSMRWVTLLELGDPGYLDQFRTFATRAEQVGQPRFLMAMAIDASLLAAMRGRFAEAERHFDEAMAGFEESDMAQFRQIPLHMRWSRLVAQGRYDEADAEVRAGGPDKSHMRLLAGLTDAETGRCGDAVQRLRTILDEADGEEPYDRVYAPLWLRFQAVAAAGSGDPELCEGARAAIAPYLDHWAVSLYGCDISGPMVLWSAVVDAAQERWDDAVAGFDRAARDADRMLAWPWAVIARLRLAEALVRRGGPGDAKTAETALARAERDGAEMGMRQVSDWAARVRVAADTGGAGAAAEPEAYRFRLDGPVWELVFDGVTAHMPDAKGLRDLHHLLGRPGVHVSAVQLLNPAGGDVVVAARGMGGDAVLDDEAKAQYRRRLAALDEEIDRAAGLGDDAKAAAFDAERAALLDELRAAAGLGGRARRLGDEAERARKTVTARIKDTLRRMGSVHPALAEHLRENVTTGAACSYHAERGIAWRL